MKINRAYKVELDPSNGKRSAENRKRKKEAEAAK